MTNHMKDSDELREGIRHYVWGEGKVADANVERIMQIIQAHYQPQAVGDEGLHIGASVEYNGHPYFICGLSTMIYDDDCTGEPEWKITKEIQEVAIVPPFTKGRDHEFHKPAWIPIAELNRKATS